MDQFNAEQYWSGREFKVWVVHLSMTRRVNRRTVRDSETKIVRARQKSGAIRCARHHSFMPARAQADARLATPRDLGCVAARTAAR